jgi:hypothetical protein
MRAWTSLVTLAFFLPVAVGCVSNEYVIPKQELARLATLPPAERGERVHVIQDIGERRGHPVDPPAQYDVSQWQEPDVPIELRVHTDVHLGGSWSTGGGSAPRGATAPGSWRGNTPGPGGDGWRGSATSSGRSGGDGWRGSATSSGSSGGGGSWRGTAGGGSSGSSGGGGSWRGTAGGSSSGSSGGGGGSGDIGGAAVFIAVLLVVVAVGAVVGLAASEGARYDGYAAMSPAQPVHIQHRVHGQTVVALGDLTPADVATSVEAKVMDDEGFGIRRLGSVLNRKGGTFKLTFGETFFERATSTTTEAGPAAHIQLGYFVTNKLGVLANIGLGGAQDGVGAILTRHELGLELQALPLSLGPLHLGGYVNGGAAMLASDANSEPAEWGGIAGLGTQIELDLTGRMALTLRGGINAARFTEGWSPAASITGGLAIY